MALLHPVATALPPNVLPQRELHAAAEAMLGPSPSTDRLLAVFENARIDSRAIAMPLDWYFAPHGHADRAQAFTQVGLRLAHEAAMGALANAGIAPADVGGILLVSTTGIATPSLDARLVHLMGLPANVVRLPVFGLGCAGGVALVNRAAELAGSLGRPVLAVALELCTLSFDIGKAAGAGGVGPDKKSLVSAALFADGCAAFVAVPAPPVGPSTALRHVAGHAHLWPHTERVMGWDVTDQGLDVVLDPGIPDIVGKGIAPVVAGFLAAQRASRPDHWVLHPGGAKVLDAFRDGLALQPAELAPAHATLRAYGNMSSPTVLFGLAAQSAAIRPGQTALLAAVGPGFAAELALLRREP